MDLTMTTKELSKRLLKHFDAHQRQSGKKTVSISARVDDIYDSLQEEGLQEELESLSLISSSHQNNNDDNDFSSWEDSLSVTVVQFVDCAFATDFSNDSKDSIFAVLELAAAVAARHVGVADKLLARLVTFSQVLLERVRSAACQGIGCIVKYLLKDSKKRLSSSNGPSSSDLLDTASQALVPRFTDKAQTVRQAAIEAAAFFFSNNQGSDAINDMDDPDLRQALQWSLQHDTSVANRTAALHALPPSSVQTVDIWLSRLRDIKPKVRVAALQALRHLSLQDDLDCEHRAGIVLAGCTDRCEATKEETKKLVCFGWMKAVKYNPVDLIKLMNVVDYEDACEKVLQIILDADDEFLSSELSDAEMRAYYQGVEATTAPIVMSTRVLELERVFFAYVRCKHVAASQKLTARQKEELQSKILPDIPVLCDLFELHAAALMKAIEEDQEPGLIDSLTCICLQLLQLTSKADMEEGARLHLQATMQRMLGTITIPDDLIEGCVKTLHELYRRESECWHALVNITEELEKAGEKLEDGLEANRSLRILSIFAILLEQASPHLTADTATVDRLSQFIVPAVKHANEYVREAAVSCFGNLGLFTSVETVMTTYKPTLLQVAINPDEKMEIRAQAILALSDWSISNAQTLEPCQVDGVSLVFSDVVFELMKHEELAVVCVAAEVACRLLFTGRICDSQWLAQLLFIFFDPRLDEPAEDEDEEDAVNVDQVGSPIRLQQLLSLFFPSYCHKSESCRHAFMGSIASLLVLVQAKQCQKRKRGKKAVPVSKMLDFAFATAEAAEVVAREKVDSSNEENAGIPETSNCSSGLLLVTQLATYLSQEHEDLSVTFLRTLCKHLGRADLDFAQEPCKSVHVLVELMEELGMVITDASCLKSFASLNELLEEVELQDEPEEEEEALNDAMANMDIALADQENQPTPLARSREDSVSAIKNMRLSDTVTPPRRGLRRTSGNAA